MAGKSRANRQATREGSPKKSWVRSLKRWTLIVFCVLAVPVIVGLAVFSSALREARLAVPSINDKIESFTKQPTIFVGVHGETLYSRSPESRTPVHFEDLKPHVWQAMLAAEDKRFMEHPGFDVMGLCRAVVNVATHKKGGGSTITMQLSKLLYNGDAQTFSRKIKDIAMAKAIEETKSKHQILEIYLNYVYFGQHSNGIYAAAKTYFNKTPNQLTIREAAMLARCVRTPSEKNPVKDYDLSIQESDYVIDTMQEMGWINQVEHDEAMAERPKVSAKAAAGDDGRYIAAPYAVRHAIEELHDKYPTIPFEEGGYKVELTIDLDLQRKVEDELIKTVNANKGRKVTAGACVLADHEGRILAEVGGLNFKRNQYNIVTKGKLQPGSSFKAIVYTAAMLEGLVHPGDTLSNRIINYPDKSQDEGYWRPQNSSKSESGPATSLESAFAMSWNRPAIWTLFAMGAGNFEDAYAAMNNDKMAHTIGRTGAEKVAKIADQIFGIKIPDNQLYPSIAIGSNLVSPMQMLEAYSVFMLKGSRVEPQIISRVTAPDGTVLIQFEPKILRDKLDGTTVQQMDDLMARVVSNGTGTAAGVVPNARGKTGTTNSNKDAWFCGYTDGLVGVVWVGNQVLDSKGHSRMLPMQDRVYGGTISAGIWAQAMLAAREKYAVLIQPPQPKRKRTPPADQALPIDQVPPDGMQIDGQTVPPGTVKVGPPDGGPDEQTPPDDTKKKPTTETIPQATPPKVTPVATPEKRQSEKRQPEKRDPEKRDPEEGQVTIEICADTGLVAGPYCPETVTRTYRMGHEPHKRCNVHKSGGG